MRLRTIALREVAGELTPAQAEEKGGEKYVAYKQRRADVAGKLAKLALAPKRAEEVKAAGIAYGKLSQANKALLHLGGELAQAQGPKAAPAPAAASTNVVTSLKGLTKAQLIELLQAQAEAE